MLQRVLDKHGVDKYIGEDWQGGGQSVTALKVVCLPTGKCQ